MKTITEYVKHNFRDSIISEYLIDDIYDSDEPKEVDIKDAVISVITATNNNDKQVTITFIRSNDLNRFSDKFSELGDRRFVAEFTKWTSWYNQHKGWLIINITEGKKPIVLYSMTSNADRDYKYYARNYNNATIKHYGECEWYQLFEFIKQK